MELPRLRDLLSKYQGQGLEIVAIDRTNDTENAQAFIQEHGLEFKFFENGEGAGEVVRNLFHVRTYPTSYLVGTDGKIRFAHVGFEEGDETRFETEIQMLLDGN